MVYFNPAAAAFYLLNDAATAWVSGAAGASGTLQNSACSVSLASSSASVSGTQLTVQFAITFAPGYAGPKNVYMYASRPGVSTGWQTRGAWTVQ